MKRDPPKDAETAFMNAPKGGLSGAVMPDWLQRWVKKIDEHEVEDPIHALRMLKCEPIAKRLAGDIYVQNYLQHFYEGHLAKGAADAEKRATSFLLAASIGFKTASATSKSTITPAERARRLPPVARAARKLANAIQGTSKYFKTGSEHIPYLMARDMDPSLVLPSEGAGFGKQSPSIREMLLSFAAALDAQAQQMKALGGMTKRVTAINLYLDDLILESYVQFEVVTYAFIAMVASSVIDQDIDESTVRKRPIAIGLACQ